MPTRIWYLLVPLICSEVKLKTNKYQIVKLITYITAAKQHSVKKIETFAIRSSCVVVHKSWSTA